MIYDSVNRITDQLTYLKNMTVWLHHQLQLKEIREPEPFICLEDVVFDWDKRISLEICGDARNIEVYIDNEKMLTTEKVEEAADFVKSQLSK